MKQLITRIDAQLHHKLANLARREGRSVNSLVTEVLTQAVNEESHRADASYRLKARKRRIVPPQPARPPSMRRVRALTRGSGRWVGEELLKQRSSR